MSSRWCSMFSFYTFRHWCNSVCVVMPFEDGMVQMKWMGRNSFRDHLCWCPDNVQQQTIRWNVVDSFPILFHALHILFHHFNFKSHKNHESFNAYFTLDFASSYSEFSTSRCCTHSWPWVILFADVVDTDWLQQWEYNLCKQYPCPCFLDTILFYTNPSVGDTQPFFIFCWRYHSTLP